MPHRRPTSRSSFQSAPSRSGTGPDADPEAAHSPPPSTGSILVWAQPGPEAEAQSLWTGALARGLGRAVTLIDVVEASGSLGAEGESELRDRARHRMNVLQRRSEADFAEVPTDLQVHVAMRAETGIVESAVSERRDYVVLWAPVQEKLIRKLLQKKVDTVLVVRSSRHRADLPWTVGVAENDRSALPMARALIAGGDQEASLEVVPELDPNAPDDAPTSVVCVSRPTPGWWSSHVLRRRRETPTSRRAIIEVYSAEHPAG